MSSVITWKVGEFGTLYGSVGRPRIFSLSRSVVRNNSTPHILRTSLPGFKEHREYASIDEAKDAAEKTLSALMNLLLKAGVQPPEAAADEKVERAAQAIARTRLQQDSPNTEAAWLDENWTLYWETVLTDRVRNEYRDQARAALQA